MSFFIKFINKITTNHYLYWFLLPFSQILIGTIIGAKQNQFNFYPFLLLYLFLLLTHLLESFLIKKRKNKLPSSPKFRRFFLFTATVLLLLIHAAVNLPAVLLLLLYIVFLLFTYHSALQLEQTIVYYILQLFFQVFILNFVAYYVQSGFINQQLITYLIPVLLLMSITIINQQLKLSSSVKVPGTYLDFIKKYATLLILTFFIGAMISIFTLFNTTNTDMSRQLLFILPIILLLFPLLSKEFRRTFSKDRYFSLLVWLSIFLFSILIKIK